MLTEIVFLGVKGPADVHELVKHGFYMKTKIDY